MNPTVFRGLRTLLLGCALLFGLSLLLVFLPRSKEVQQNPEALTVTEKLQAVLLQKLGTDVSEFYQVIAAPAIDDFLAEYNQKIIEGQVLPRYMANSQDIEIFIVKESVSNAFALPGGKIIITSGLILATENAAELLGVLAHEVGHVLYQHVSRSLVLQLSAATLGAWLSGGQVPTAILASISTLSFSREFEHAADQFSIRRLEHLGVSPIYLADFLQRIEMEEEGKIPDFLTSHSATKKRTEEAKSAAIDYGLNNMDSSSFNPNFGLDWGMLQENLQLAE